MKKVKLLITLLIILSMSIVGFKYYKAQKPIYSIKNQIKVMENIISKNKLSYTDENDLKKIQDTNWDLLFDTRNSDKNIQYILVTNDIANNIILYFENSNLKAKDTALKQIKETKKAYNIID